MSNQIGYIISGLYYLSSNFVAIYVLFLLMVSLLYNRDLSILPT
jgi:hypothetical protein